MSKEDGFSETKITTVKMFEPYKIKLVPFSKGKYGIELTLNGDAYLADKIKNEEGEIVKLIESAKWLITEKLNCDVLEREKE